MYNDVCRIEDVIIIEVNVWRTLTWTLLLYAYEWCESFTRLCIDRMNSGLFNIHFCFQFVGWRCSFYYIVKCLFAHSERLNLHCFVLLTKWQSDVMWIIFFSLHNNYMDTLMTRNRLTLWKICYFKHRQHEIIYSFIWQICIMIFLLNFVYTTLNSCNFIKCSVEWKNLFNSFVCYVIWVLI